jgi:hypothetical protein
VLQELTPSLEPRAVRCAQLGLHAQTQQFGLFHVGHGKVAQDMSVLTLVLGPPVAQCGRLQLGAVVPRVVLMPPTSAHLKGRW